MSFSGTGMSRSQVEVIKKCANMIKKWAAQLMDEMRLAVGIGMLTVAMAAAAVGGEAQHGEAAPTCSNLASGASWQIRIDYDKATVDTYPARISDAQISWHDPTDGGNYTLDRKSGELTVIFASSTGGYFLHHRCKPES
jgi:hypothetical protein